MHDVAVGMGDHPPKQNDYRYYSIYDVIDPDCCAGYALSLGAYHAILSVHATMLAYQSSTLGLFPRGKSQHARVRDNVYCAAALWCFSLAYR